LLAITRDDAAAYTTLATTLTHPHEQVRALGAFYLAQAYGVPRRPLPAPVAAALGARATHDAAFAPRFQARLALRRLGRPVPQDDPALVYVLKVQLRGNRATRTIAVRPEDTLSDLHYAIQHAFAWDIDRLDLVQSIFVYAILYAILQSTTYNYRSVYGEANLSPP
jgi:hypothetical protein